MGRPMVKRRSLVSGVVKAKHVSEEAEVEGITEERLLKALKGLAAYVLFLGVFAVPSGPASASTLPTKPQRRGPPRTRTPRPRPHPHLAAPPFGRTCPIWQVVVFSPRSSHDFWANAAMKQLFVEKRFHFGTLASGTPAAPHEKTVQDVHTHEQFFYWLKVLVVSSK